MSDSFPKCVVTSTPVRLAFPSLFERTHAMRNNPTSPLQYSALFLLKPDHDLTPYKKAMAAAWREKFGADTKRRPVRPPLKPCAPKQDGTYAQGFVEGWWTLSASSRTRQPVVVGRNPSQIITDPAKVYAGCWVNAQVSAWVWEHASGSGVSFNLDMVQFVDDDAPFGGGTNNVPETAFPKLDEALAGADEAFENLAKKHGLDGSRPGELSEDLFQ